MATIEELTTNRDELYKGLKKSVRDSLIIYGGFLLASWVAFGSFTGKWKPKEYINYFKERQENSKPSGEIPFEKYHLF